MLELAQHRDQVDPQPRQPGDAPVDARQPVPLQEQRVQPRERVQLVRNLHEHVGVGAEHLELRQLAVVRAAASPKVGAARVVREPPPAASRTIQRQVIWNRLISIVGK